MTEAPRILVVATQPSSPPYRGDRNRLFHTLRLLRSIGNVRLACLIRDWEPPAAPDMDGLPFRTTPIARGDVLRATVSSLALGLPPMAFRFTTESTRRFMTAQIAEFQPDLVWAFQISSAPLLDYQRPTVVDLVDSPSRYVSAIDVGTGIGLGARIEAFLNRRIGAYERKVALSAGAVLVNSPSDRTQVERLAPAASVQVLPNCVPRALLDRQWHPHVDRTKKLLFVGNLAYPPHLAAVRSFIAHILPILRKVREDAELVVAGPGGHLLPRADSVPGLRVLGIVPDLAALYESSDLLVSPHSVVMGLQYKILEAMAVGLPIVASEGVIAGTDLRGGVHLLTAQSDQEFATLVVRALDDPALCQVLSRQAKRFVADNYVWESHLLAVQSLVSRLTA